jgi:Mn2+/Fe2+ NRAMP family transporter
MEENAAKDNGIALKTAPKGLAVLLVVGPSMIWCAEYIGSGEVILSPRAGSILGIGVLWAVLMTILLKCFIGMSGARYTACTGEGMVDMFDRMPGPRHWAVWIVLVVQFVAGALSTGALASASGSFVGNLVGTLAHIEPESRGWLIQVCGWVVAFFALAIAWSGGFNILKMVMSFFVLLIILGALYSAVHVFPGFAALLQGLSFQVPQVPEWAIAKGVNSNPWKEILPLMGWAAGGFASQVWYTYWVIGGNYGMTEGRGYGKPADVGMLKSLTRSSAEKIKGWCRVVYTDATVATTIGIVVVSGFLIAGSGVLRPAELVPQQKTAAVTLSQIFAKQWGEIGGIIYLVAGSAALVSTLLGQLAGWPRLLADCFRICIPPVGRNVPWKQQFRFFLLLFFCTNMIIVYALGKEPVRVIQLAAILDGVLLTAFQAIWVGVGLYFVLPRILSKEAYEVLKPGWVFAVPLAVTAIVFGYLCIIQIPPVVMQFFKG